MLILIAKPIWSPTKAHSTNDKNIHFSCPSRSPKNKNDNNFNDPSKEALLSQGSCLSCRLLIKTKPKSSHHGEEEKMLFWLLWHNNEVNGELWTREFDLYTFCNSFRSSSSLTRQCIWLTFTRPGYPFGKLRGGYKKAQKLEPNRTNKAWEINHSRGLSELMPIPNRYTWHNITDESWSGREINERTDYPNDFWWTLHSRRWSFFSSAAKQSIFFIVK